MLFAPLTYRQASSLTIAAICNGCGSKGLGGWIVPNTLYGLSIEQACQIHDWMYFDGNTIADKEEADRVFLNNMLRIIDTGSRFLAWFRRRRALKYYEAVHLFGGPAYWADKNTPDEMRGS